MAEALVIIHRDKIADPVFFLSDFLRKRGEELEVRCLLCIFRVVWLY